MLDGVLAQLGDDHRQAGGDVGGEQTEAALADRGHPTPGGGDLADHPQQSSATLSNSTISSKAWASVSCTMAIEETRDIASLSATRASGEEMRRDCIRSSAATVCRLFLTRWWISRMVASLVTSRRSLLRRH